MLSAGMQEHSFTINQLAKQGRGKQERQMLNCDTFPSLWTLQMKSNIIFDRPQVVKYLALPNMTEHVIHFPSPM